jgi:hypothetical protein
MAVQIEHPDKTVQWLAGGDFALPVNLQTVPQGCEIISMAPDKSILDWTRRAPPFSDRRFFRITAAR